MPSTYTVNLGIEKPATGEQSGTWGDTTNTNFDILDQAINGAVRVTLTSAGTSGSPNQLQITNGAASDGRNKWIEIYSASDLGGSAYLQLDPNDAEKILFIRNSLAGSQSILLFQGTYDAARDLEVPAGVDMVVKFDGGGASAATVTDVYTKLRVTELTTPTLTATTADINGGTLDNSVIGGTTAAAITGTTIVANTSLNIAGDGATVTGIKDEDDMSSNSATKLATQQSIKAYVDSQVGTVDTWAEVLANGATSGSTNPEVTAGQALKTNTINETSAGSGVTIDSVLLKDDVVNATDIEVSSISANDGTEVATLANSTGVITIASSVLTTTDINAGTIDNTTIGGTTAAVGTFTQVNVDNITIDGTEIDLSSGDLTIDVAGDIKLDAAGNDWIFLSGGTAIGRIINSSSDFVIQSDVADKDIIFKGDDGGSGITALTLDMSNEGRAFFNAGASLNGNVNLTDNDAVIFGDGDDFKIYHNSVNNVIQSVKSDADLYIVGKDGASDINALIFDMSEAGEATFNDDINLGDSKRLRMGAGGDFEVFHDGSNNYIKGATSDQDLYFQGVDGGSTITALILDMSQAGRATFNEGIVLKSSSAGDFGVNINTASGDSMKLQVVDTGTAGAADGTISVSDGDLNLDVSGSIVLDADSGEIALKDGGTEFGQFAKSGTEFRINQAIQDGDIVFRGNDGGSIITALTIDMSAAGQATFNAGAIVQDDFVLKNGSPELYFATTGDHYNWRIAAQEAVDAAIEIAVGEHDTNWQDDTYTPVLVLKNTGSLELGYSGATRQQADNQAFSIVTPATGGGQGIALKRLDTNTDQQLGELSWSNNTQDGLANIRVKTAGAANTVDMLVDINNAGSAITALTFDGSNEADAKFNRRIGLGATPDYPLHIRSSVSATVELDTTFIYMNNPSDGGAVIEFLNGVGAKGQMGFLVDSTGSGTDEVDFRIVTSAANGGSLTNRLEIDSYGNIKMLAINGAASAVFGGTNLVNGITGVPSNAGTPFVVGRDTGTNRSMQIAGHLNIDAGYGIGFGASAGSGASSTVLDDYEEGTWTPEVYYQNTTDQANATNVVQDGKYTKIGNLVFLQFRLDFSQSSASPANDNIGVKNLPFAGAHNHYAGGGNVITSTTQTGLNWQLPQASSSLLILLNSANVGNFGDEFGTGSNKYMRGSVTYMTST